MPYLGLFYLKTRYFSTKGAIFMTKYSKHSSHSNSHYDIKSTDKITINNRPLTGNIKNLASRPYIPSNEKLDAKTITRILFLLWVFLATEGKYEEAYEFVKWHFNQNSGPSPAPAVVRK